MYAVLKTVQLPSTSMKVTMQVEGDIVNNMHVDIKEVTSRHSPSGPLLARCGWR